MKLEPRGSKNGHGAMKPLDSSGIKKLCRRDRRHEKVGTCLDSDQEIVGSGCRLFEIKAVELKEDASRYRSGHLGLEPIAPDIVVDSMIWTGTVRSGDLNCSPDTGSSPKQWLRAGQRPLVNREKRFRCPQ